MTRAESIPSCGGDIEIHEEEEAEVQVDILEAIGYDGSRLTLE